MGAVVGTMLGGLTAASGLIMNTTMIEDNFMKEMPDLAEYLVFGGVALALLSIFCCMFNKDRRGLVANVAAGVGIATTIGAGVFTATTILMGEATLDMDIGTFVQHNMYAIYILGGIAGLSMIIGMVAHIVIKCSPVKP